MKQYYTAQGKRIPGRIYRELAQIHIKDNNCIRTKYQTLIAYEKTVKTELETVKANGKY